MEERSAGAVVYRETENGREYLLLMNAGRWDFPKGGVEKGEGELHTVMREVREETGLRDFALVPGFRRVIEYFYRRDRKNIHKQVVYLLAYAPDARVRISSEHQGFGWFPYQEAIGMASYDNSKKTLAEAEKFVSTKSPLRTEPRDEARTA
jgi:8-oxo-dGTP pyrophosphatase MutT (NUDIX family)